MNLLKLVVILLQNVLLKRSELLKIQELEGFEWILASLCLMKVEVTQSGFPLKRVQDGHVDKTLISDPPIGGSTDHVDRRGVWGNGYFYNGIMKGRLGLLWGQFLRFEFN